jgi:hypothetical protein
MTFEDGKPAQVTGESGRGGKREVHESSKCVEKVSKNLQSGYNRNREEVRPSTS